MHKPKRKYGSPEALESALTRTYNSFFKEYVEAPTPPNILYHYCSEDVMRQILLGSRSLWASDIFRMNDTEEITYAFSDVLPFARGIVKEQWGRLCVHIACFSDSELPSQWQRYAKDCTGCAIGFERSALQNWCRRRQGLLSLFPMNYDGSRHQEMMNRFRDRVNRLFEPGLLKREWNNLAAAETLPNKATVYLFSLAMTLKHECWRDEREWRILVTQPKDYSPTRKHYFNPFPRQDNGACCFALPICTPELVAEVVVGPRCGLDAEELKRQLNAAGFSSVGVRHTQSG